MDYPAAPGESQLSARLHQVLLHQVGWIGGWEGLGPRAHIQGVFNIASGTKWLLQPNEFDQFSLHKKCGEPQVECGAESARGSGFFGWQGPHGQASVAGKEGKAWYRTPLLPTSMIRVPYWPADKGRLVKRSRDSCRGRISGG